MKRILVNSGSMADLLYLLALIWLDYKADNLRNPSNFLVGFNETETLSFGEIVLLISTGPVTTPIPLTVIDEPSSFNSILGCTWIHAMKALSSSYHQRLSFLTPLRQIDIAGV